MSTIGNNINRVFNEALAVFHSTPGDFDTRLAAGQYVILRGLVTGTGRSKGDRYKGSAVAGLFTCYCHRYLENSKLVYSDGSLRLKLPALRPRQGECHLEYAIRAMDHVLDAVDKFFAREAKSDLREHSSTHS